MVEGSVCSAGEMGPLEMPCAFAARRPKRGLCSGFGFGFVKHGCLVSFDAKNVVAA